MPATFGLLWLLCLVYRIDTTVPVTCAVKACKQYAPSCASPREGLWSAISDLRLVGSMVTGMAPRGLLKTNIEVSHGHVKMGFKRFKRLN
jgi:hypothetical protein